MAYLSIAAQLAFNIAAGETQALRHVNIDTEHLFLGLCKIEDLLSSGITELPGISEMELQQARNEITGFVDILNTNRINCKYARRALRKLLQESGMEMGAFSGHRTNRCKNVFAFAERICREAAMMEVCLLHLLGAVLSSESLILDKLFDGLMAEKSILAGNLRKMGVLKEGNYVDIAEQTANKTGLPLDNPVEAPNGRKTPFLNKYGRDITKLARDGKLDPVIGRASEIKKLAQVLVQKKKNNPILVGDAGVGKTCIVEGFAQKVIEADAPAQIKNYRIIELSMGSLVAGTKYRGEFEEKLDSIIKESASDPDIVLFIDEIHTMVGAGATGEGGMDAGNILKPALARGDIKCIGATTTAEYRKYIEKDAALERRFQLIWVDEPSYSEAVQILKGLKPKYEEYHSIKIPDRVIEKAVEMSMRYLIDYRLPDKAIDVIDQACARRLIKTLSPGELNRAGSGDELAVEDIARVISERCRIPVDNLTIEESGRLLEMESFLKKRIIGQDEAVKAVADTIRTSKAGLKDSNKPLGIFLFLGSTGTGKTELAKALAEFLFHDENRLITFDMSEYGEKHTVARLIGAPPGYVGHDEEGQLTSRIRSYPYSVILFDEIEKAHPDIFNLFLQIFDEGRLTDSRGRRANFSEAVIILTSNLGSAVPGASFNTGVKHPIGFHFEAEEKPKPVEDLDVTITLDGFDKPENVIEPLKADREKWKGYEQQIMKAVGASLRPEIINRVQKKVVFYPLEKETIKIIIDKYLAGLNKLLYSKGVQVALDESAKEFLIEKGFNKTYGAREMKRVFDQIINEPLSRKLLSGEISSGCVVRVYADGESTGFKME